MENTIEFTSFQLFYKKNVKNKNRQVWKVRCGYRKANGKPDSKRMTLKHNGMPLVVQSSNKKLVQNCFDEFKIMMRKGNPSSEYVTSNKTFYEAVMETERKDKKNQKETAFKIVEIQYDGSFRNKKINQVLRQEYIVGVKKAYQRMINMIEDGDIDDVKFPSRKLKTSTIKGYFSHFKHACNMIMKEKPDNYYPINLKAIGNIVIDEDKLEKQGKKLTDEQLEFIDKSPTYYEIAESRRGSWVTRDWNIKEALQFAIKSSLRQGDLKRVKWNMFVQNVDSNGDLHRFLRIVTKKKEKPAFIPITDETWNNLPKERKGIDEVFKLPKTNIDMCYALKRWLRYAKKSYKKDIDNDIHWHDARRTYMQRFMETTGDARMCAKICGCTVKNVLKTYTEVSEYEMIEMANSVAKMYDKKSVTKRSI